MKYVQFIAAIAIIIVTSTSELLSINEETPRHEMTLKPVVYEISGMENIIVQRDVVFEQSENSNLAMDIYLPNASLTKELKPAVIFVYGYSDSSFEKILGCKFKEMQCYITWARLVAASGIVAITYSNQNPQNDLQSLLEYIKKNAVDLGIDADRMAIWASSGNVPLALFALTQKPHSFKCGVLYYGFMLDLDQSTFVADAAKQFLFVNPSMGKSITDLPPTLPLFLARAGLDQTPHLNDSFDLFVNAALSHNLPITVENYSTGVHAFDLLDASDKSRNIIRKTLDFLKFHLDFNS